ncbi:MAG: hypothetical protein K6T65_17035 [Peptococcaceae bacterium]|nr:hypothetical protein [Peptococcaceae bacterium]
MDNITAWLNGYSWPVRVVPLGDGNYKVTGRGTELLVANRPSGCVGGGEYLVAVVNYNRCGCLDVRKWTAEDMRQYIGIENRVDAATLVAALNALFV